MIVVLSLILADAKKVEFNNAMDNLYLTGPKGLSKVAANGANLRTIYSNKPDRAGTTLKRNSQNHMLSQQPGKNDLYCFDDNGIERERIPGKPDPSPADESFCHYRHSLDDRYILWRNGNKDLEVFDCESMKNDETISGFWHYRGQPTKPVAAISDREVSRILAVSQIDLNNQAIHYLEKDFKTGVDYVNVGNVKEVFPNCKIVTHASQTNHNDGGVR